MPSRGKLKTAVMSAALSGVVVTLPLAASAQSADQILQKGMHNQNVKPVQKQLQKYHYYGGQVDGVYGANTRQAVTQIQSDYNIATDGIYGSKTSNALNKTQSLQKKFTHFPLLQDGSQGQKVKALQKQLQRLHYYHGHIDSIFGSQTEAAVRAFQKANQLAEDGITGPHTYKALTHDPVSANKAQSSHKQTSNQKASASHQNKQTSTNHQNQVNQGKDQDSKTMNHSESEKTNTNHNDEKIKTTQNTDQQQKADTQQNNDQHQSTEPKSEKDHHQKEVTNQNKNESSEKKADNNADRQPKTVDASNTENVKATDNGQAINYDKSAETQDGDQEGKNQQPKAKSTNKDSKTTTSTQGKNDNHQGNQDKKTTSKPDKSSNSQVRAQSVQKDTDQAKNNQSNQNVQTISVTSTAYSPDCVGCSGVTYTGIDLKSNPNKKVIAVDPSVIPLGSTVIVPGYGKAVAGDIGGDIKGNRIDVAVPNKNKALNYGVKSITVKVIKKN